MTDSSVAQWFYMGDLCEPDGAEAEYGKLPTALWFRMKDGARVRVPVNCETGEFDGVFYALNTLGDDK